MRVRTAAQPKPGTRRAKALYLLIERGAMTSAEFSAALGIRPDCLNAVVRDFVVRGVMVRTPLEENRPRYRYTMAEGAEFRRPARAVAVAAGQPFDRPCFFRRDVI